MKLLIGIGVAALVIIGVVVALEQRAPAITPLPPVNEEAPSDEFSAADGTRLSWEGGAINIHRSNLGARQKLTQTLYLGAGTDASVALRSSNPDVTLALTSPSGAAVKPELVVATDEQTGETIKIYKVPPHRESGEWHVTVTNPNPEASSTVDISTPGATPPLAVIPGTPPVNPPPPPGGGVVLSISVEESGGPGGLTVKTVSGAKVTAIVTAPDGKVTEVPLTEDPHNPGTYTGVYPGPVIPGVYHVEYIIEGKTSDGQDFTQITQSDFAVTGTPGASSTPSQWNKKYDINRGDAVDIIGY